MECEVQQILTKLVISLRFIKRLSAENNQGCIASSAGNGTAIDLKGPTGVLFSNLSEGAKDEASL